MFKKILFLISFLVFLGGCFWIYQNNESEKKRVLEEVNKKPLLREEVTLIIIPGDTINDIKRKLVKLEFLNGSSTVKTEDLDLLIGLQAEFSDESGFVKKLRENNEFLKDKPIRVSLEGYFPADTFRFYKNEQVEKVIKDLIIFRGKEMAEKLEEIKNKNLNYHEAFVLASLLEKEVRGEVDQKKVADILIKRWSNDWGLQLDSTIHYIYDESGNVFTTPLKRAVDSLWNTYKYRDLPASPIGTFKISTLDHLLNREKNDYWYFLNRLDTGETVFAKNLDEHNRNVYKFLR